MGYVPYTVPDTEDIELRRTTIVASFSTSKHKSMASRDILANFSVKNSELKPPTKPLGIVACTLNCQDNLSRNSCVQMKNALTRGRKTNEYKYRR